jgi:hypothetical protein
LRTTSSDSKCGTRGPKLKQETRVTTNATEKLQQTVVTAQRAVVVVGSDPSPEIIGALKRAVAPHDDVGEVHGAAGGSWVA